MKHEKVLARQYDNRSNVFPIIEAACCNRVIGVPLHLVSTFGYHYCRLV